MYTVVSKRDENGHWETVIRNSHGKEVWRETMDRGLHPAIAYDDPSQAEVAQHYAIRNFKALGEYEKWDMFR